MANQSNTTVMVIAQEGQQVTVIGPSGQQVTVNGKGGKVTITFTSDVVNVIPEEEPVVEEEVVEEEVVDEEVVEEEVVEEEVEEEVVELPGPALQYQWPTAQPGSFFFRIDTIVNARKELSCQVSNAELEDLASLMKMNKKVFDKIIEQMNLPANTKRNIQTRIRRFLNPELVRESNRKSLERYHRMKNA